MYQDMMPWIISWLQLNVTNYVWHLKSYVQTSAGDLWVNKNWLTPRRMPCGRINVKKSYESMTPHTVYTSIINLEYFSITESTWENLDRNSPDLIAHFDMELTANFTLCCSKSSVDQWHTLPHSKNWENNWTISILY